MQILYGYSIPGSILQLISIYNTQTDPTTNLIDPPPCCPHSAQQSSFCADQAPGGNLGAAKRCVEI